MDYTTRTMLEMSAACLLFLIAAASGVWLFQTSAALADSAYAAGTTQNRSIQQTFSPLSGDGSLSGAELFQMIARLEEGDQAIVVNGNRYAAPVNREQWRPDSIQLDGRYIVSHERDTDGRLLNLRVVAR